MDYKLFFIPIVSAAIGYFTNFIAVRMIFRPFTPVKIWFITIQGLIPKRRSELAFSIARTVESNLINSKDIIDNIKSVGLDGDFKWLIEEKIDSFIDKRLVAMHPVISMFITGEMKSKVKKIFLEELEEILPVIYEKTADKLEMKLDLHKIVYNKIEAFPLEKLEKIILEIAARELRAIEILGAALGFLIGAIQFVIMSLL